VARTHDAVKEQQPIEVIDFVLHGARLVTFAVELETLPAGILASAP